MTDYISCEVLLSAAKGYDWIAGLKTVLKRIPAADVRPVVRGKWKRYAGLIEGIPFGECSNCLALRPIGNFCPNCGADMREES